MKKLRWVYDYHLHPHLGATPGPRLAGAVPVSQPYARTAPAPVPVHGRRGPYLHWRGAGVVLAWVYGGLGWYGVVRPSKLRIILPALLYQHRMTYSATYRSRDQNSATSLFTGERLSFKCFPRVVIVVR